MTAAPKSYHRYLLADSKDRNWGIYATTAGYVEIDPGMPYPPSGHPKNYSFRWEHGRKLDEVQVHLIARGDGIFESAKGTPRGKRIAPGNAFILFPQVWHRYMPREQTGWLEYWIGLKGHYVDTLLKNRFFAAGHPVFTGADTSTLLRLFTEAISCLRHHSVGTSRILGSLGGLILAELQASTVEVQREGTRVEILAHEAKIMLGQHLEQNLDLELLAKKLNVGYHWLRRSFKQETGQSLHHYRLQIRISRAMVLLKSSDLTVEQIAQQTGFEDASYFSQIFKRKIGSSPTGWRRARPKAPPPA